MECKPIPLGGAVLTEVAEETVEAGSSSSDHIPFRKGEGEGWLGRGNMGDVDLLACSSSDSMDGTGSASSWACNASFISLKTLMIAGESGDWRRRQFLLRSASAMLIIIPTLHRSGALTGQLKILRTQVISSQHSNRFESAGSKVWSHSSVMVSCVAGRGWTKT